MSYQPKWPASAPDELRSQAVVEALGAVEARRLATVLGKAEAAARARLAEAAKAVEQAQIDATRLIDEAKAEAEAIIAGLPDFAAIEAAPASDGNSAMRAIRDAADRQGIALAAVIGTSQNPKAKLARLEAALRVAEACPTLTNRQLGRMFKRSGPAFAWLLRKAKEARRRGEI